MLKLLFKTLFLFGFISVAQVSFAQTSAETHRLSAERLVSQAADALPEFEAKSHEWNDRIAGYLKQAKAVMVVPKLYKGGLFIGGEKGEAVLLVRQENGSWSYPAFYRLYSASLGFQVGFEKSKNLLLIMSDNALQALLTNKFDIGGEVNVAVGTAGGSAEVSTTSNLNLDILSYSLGTGAYAGISFEGGYVEQDIERNSHYYEADGVETAEILRGQYENYQAERLLELISKYAD